MSDLEAIGSTATSATDGLLSTLQSTFSCSTAAAAAAGIVTFSLFVENLRLLLTRLTSEVVLLVSTPSFFKPSSFVGEDIDNGVPDNNDDASAADGLKVVLADIVVVVAVEVVVVVDMVANSEDEDIIPAE